SPDVVLRELAGWVLGGEVRPGEAGLGTQSLGEELSGIVIAPSRDHSRALRVAPGQDQVLGRGGVLTHLQEPYRVQSVPGACPHLSYRQSVPELGVHREGDSAFLRAGCGLRNVQQEV